MSFTMRLAFLAGVVLILTSAVSRGVHTASSTSFPLLRAPFSQGNIWRVQCGYNSGSDGPCSRFHSGNDRYSLDLVVDGDGAPTWWRTNGKAVRNPFQSPTRVQGINPTYGGVCLSAGGYSVKLYHMEPTTIRVKPGAWIDPGTVLGNVAAPGRAANNNVSHIHMTLYSGTFGEGRCDGLAGVPFDFVEGVYNQFPYSPTPGAYTCPNIDCRRISNGWTAEFFNNMKFEGTPVHVRADLDVSFDWYLGSPVPGVVNPDNFSVRWTRPIGLTEGTYEFCATVDDGIQVFVDAPGYPSRLVIDSWKDQSRATYCKRDYFGGGAKTLRIQYKEHWSAAMIQFSMRKCPC